MFKNRLKNKIIALILTVSSFLQFRAQAGQFSNYEINAKLFGVTIATLPASISTHQDNLESKISGEAEVSGAKLTFESKLNQEGIPLETRYFDGRNGKKSFYVFNPETRILASSTKNYLCPTNQFYNFPAVFWDLLTREDDGHDTLTYENYFNGDDFSSLDINVINRNPPLITYGPARSIWLAKNLKLTINTATDQLVRANLDLLLPGFGRVEMKLMD